MPALRNVRRLVVLALVAGAIYVHCRGGGAERATSSARTPAAARGAAIVIKRGALRLEGQALDEKQRPIGGAMITLDGTRTTTAETDGSFAFDALAPGDYDLIAEAGAAFGEREFTLYDRTGSAVITLYDGPTLVVHVVDRAGVPVVGAQVTPQWRQELLADRDGKVICRGVGIGTAHVDVVAHGYASVHTDFDVGDDPRRTIDETVVLDPGSAIGGLVIDEDGAAVAGAKVSVTSARGYESTEADGFGRWRLDDVGAGKLALDATSAEANPASDLRIVVDGATPRLDLVLRVERAATLAGVAVDIAGRPIAGLDVWVLAPNAPFRDGVTDDHGRFTVAGVGAGDVEVDASNEELGTPKQIVAVPRRGHAEVKLVMVESSITGIVTNLQGEPVADAHVTINGPTITYKLSDAFGHFALGRVVPGDYKVTVTRDSASDLGLGLAERHAVDVHSGDHHVALVLPDAGTITGRVILDGRPVDYFGIAVSDDPMTIPEPRRSTDGRFEVEVQPTSEWPEMRQVMVVGPGFQRRVVEDVLVTTGRSADIGDVVVTAGRGIRGRVIDSIGMPIAGAAVVVQSGDSLETEVSLRKENGASRGAHSDASGSFEIAGLPDDVSGLEIQAQDSAHGLTLPRVLTTADLDGNVELVLAATGSLAGTVSDEDSFDQIKVMSLADGRSYEVFARDGELAITQLPPGDYRAWLDPNGTVTPPVAFQIVANQTTSISFAQPAALITVDASFAGEPCIGALITSIDVDVGNTDANDWVRWFDCTDATHAVIGAIAPGRYQICNSRSECTTVDIAASPERQSVTLGEPPYP